MSDKAGHYGIELEFKCRIMGQAGFKGFSAYPDHFIWFSVWENAHSVSDPSAITVRRSTDRVVSRNIPPDKNSVSFTIHSLTAAWRSDAPVAVGEFSTVDSEKCCFSGGHGLWSRSAELFFSFFFYEQKCYVSISWERHSRRVRASNKGISSLNY